jgi:penicillin-binding protein 1C
VSSGREERAAPARAAQARRPRPGRGWRAAFYAVWGIATAAMLSLLVILSVVQTVRADLPPVPRPSDVATSTIVVDRNGLLLRPFTIADGRWRLPVSAGDVDPLFFAMLFAYEDQHFPDHAGVDWAALLRAAVQYFGAGGEIVSGGSTLTMQVARLIDGGNTRTIAGKIRQIVFAREIERQLAKSEILDLYLLLAPYGGNLEGIRAATIAYFGKEPARLTPAQAALLVALTQSPEARRPDHDPDAAEAARNRVLDRAVIAGVLEPEEAEAAKTEPVPVARQDFPLLAAHLAEAAIRVDSNAPVHQLTVDRQRQIAYERLAADRAEAFGADVSVAILLVDHRTGEIIASVGSAGLLDLEREGFVDMTRAVRSPGSTLKPFIYGLAFELGLALPASLIEDRPTGFGNYAPVNFDGYYRGTVTIREALEQSLNVPAVVVLNEVGPALLVSRLRRAGAEPVLPDLTAPGLAIGLGGVGVTLRGLVGAYAAIANGGLPVALDDGIERPSRFAALLPVLDPISAWYVADILAGVPPPVTASIGRVAYKTGTSYGYRDAWAVGFDGRHAIGVWVGRPDGSPVPGLTGIGAAAPILFEAFDRIGAPTEPLLSPPAGVASLTTAQIPEPIRRFRVADATVIETDPLPEIFFPVDGARVDLGLGRGAGNALVIKVRNGSPPFTFLANGLPIARSDFAREESWLPDGPGFVTLAVIDGDGRSDRVTVFLE